MRVIVATENSSSYLFVIFASWFGWRDNYQSFYRNELWTLGIQFFMQFQKAQQIDNRLKIN